MSAVPVKKYTIREYLAREEAAAYKSEFFRGQIFAMSGGTINHNTIAGNIFGHLFTSLRGSGCRPFNSDQRIRVVANGLDTYPDVSVVCGEIERDEEDQEAISNPRVIIEVLSPSTERYNRGEKFRLLQESRSLQEYILVAQDKAQVERFVRQPDDSWNLTYFQGNEAVLVFSSLNCSISLREIYAEVTFDPEEGGIASR